MVKGKQTSDETRSAIVEDIRGGMSPMLAAKEHGVHWSTAYRIARREGLVLLKDEDTADIANAYSARSLKARVLDTMRRIGEVKTPDELIHELKADHPGEHFDRHQVVHVLYSAQKGGLVRFNESKPTTSKGQSIPVDIVWLGAMDPKPVVADHIVTPSEDEVPIAAGTATMQSGADDQNHGLILDPDEYPLLAALRERATKSQERARLLLEAAQYATNRGQEQTLLDMAAAAEKETNLSHIETEYLRFAKAYGITVKENVHDQ